MKYKVGDRVRIKSIDWYKENRNDINEVKCGVSVFVPAMTTHCGYIRTISKVFEIQKVYHILEDNDLYTWTDEMIEGLVEEETKPKFKIGDKITNGKTQLTILQVTSDKYIVEDNFGECGTLYFNTQDDWKLVEEEKSELIPYFEEGTNKILYYKNKNTLECYFPMRTPEHICPEGYIFKDENGNVINATKIVLEKKKKDYPKTYAECCRVLGVSEFEYNHTGTNVWYRHKLMATLDKLILCRDAYWKIAGEDMGLGKSWEPDWNHLSDKWVLFYTSNRIGFQVAQTRHSVFAFPTEEMRDAFKENFDPDIEICKEFL